MDRNRATYEAFDGVEIPLAGGSVLRVDAFSTREAVHYLRLWSRVGEDPSAHQRFLQEFPERVGILETPLAELGFSCSFEGREISGESITVAQGLHVETLVARAGNLDGWEAQAELLETFPAMVGLELAPHEVFEVAGGPFREALHLAIYGLARDFLTRLGSSPRARAETEGAPSASRSSRGSTT